MSFEQHFKGFCEATYSHFSIFGFWWISVISEFSFLDIGFITKTQKSRKIFIFWYITVQCVWICVLTTAAWLAIWLDHFEIDVLWTTFKEFLNLHIHISVFWGFWWITGISKSSFLGIGHKTKTRKSWKIFIFWFITLQCMWICVLTTILTVWVLKLT